MKLCKKCGQAVLDEISEARGGNTFRDAAYQAAIEATTPKPKAEAEPEPEPAPAAQEEGGEG